MRVWRVRKDTPLRGLGEGWHPPLSVGLNGVSAHPHVLPLLGSKPSLLKQLSGILCTSTVSRGRKKKFVDIGAHTQTGQANGATAGKNGRAPYYDWRGRVGEKSPVPGTSDNTLRNGARTYMVLYCARDNVPGGTDETKFRWRGRQP